MEGTSAYKFTEFNDDMNRILNYPYRSLYSYKWVSIDNFPKLPKRVLHCLVLRDK